MIRPVAALALARRILSSAMPEASEEAVQLTASLIVFAVKADEIAQEHERKVSVVKLLGGGLLP